MEKKSKILIADDDPTMIDLLKNLLQIFGYEIVIAINGQEALDKAKSTKPDLILLDVEMPKMNGFDVCKAVRADDSISRIPIVMVTGLKDGDSRITGIRSGADDFISKPFDSVELEARVKNIVELNRYRLIAAEKEKLAWAVEKSSEAYMIVDKSDRILYANETAKTYFDLEDADLNSEEKYFMETAKKIYQPEPYEIWDDWREEEVFSDNPGLFLIRPESDSAKSLWLSANVLQALGASGEERLLHFKDVTDSIDKYQEIRSFHGMISHKMRTPVSSLLGSLDLLDSYRSELSINEIGDLIKVAKRGLERLHEEIEDVLKYVESPKFAKYGKPFILENFRKYVENTTRELFLEKVRFSGLNKIPERRLFLSEDAMRWILFELLENSKRFHPKNDPEIDIETDFRDDFFFVTVRDDGIRLAPEHLSKIFIPYYQGEKYFTGQSEGMGLGLATASSLIWEIGGSVKARNRKDKDGLEISFSLPVK